MPDVSPPLIWGRYCRSLMLETSCSAGVLRCYVSKDRLRPSRQRIHISPLWQHHVHDIGAESGVVLQAIGPTGGGPVCQNPEHSITVRPRAFLLPFDSPLSTERQACGEHCRRSGSPVEGCKRSANASTKREQVRFRISHPSLVRGGTA